MMHKLKKLTSKHSWASMLFAIGMLFFGCGGGDDDQPTPVTPDKPDNPTAPYCKGSFSDVVVLSKNELGPMIYLDTNIPLENISLSVEPGGEWLHPEIDDFQNGEYNRTITLHNDGYANKNEYGDKIYEHYRTAILRIKAGTVYDKRVTIVQEGNIILNTYIKLYYGNVLYMNPTGETKDVKVITNCYSWTPSTDADWVTLVKKDDRTLTVTTKPRAAGNDKKRVAEITITNDKVDWQKDETQFKVADGDPNISGENYNYDDEITGWD